MIRMKYRLDDNKKLLPMVWNRWRGFIAFRKLVKYQFNFCSNSTANDKADMQRAFNKWRRGPEQLTDELSKLDFKTLRNLGLKCTDELKECSDNINENHAIKNHLVL